MRFLAAMLLLTSFSATGAPNYTYCEIAGLAFGAEKEFIGTVASRIVDRQRLLGNPGCHAVWKDSFETGKRLSAGGPWSDLDHVKWRKLQDFETKVLDSIVDRLQLGL